MRIAALDVKLAELRAIPSHRRSVEFVPQRIEAVMQMLAHLRRKKWGE